MVQGQQNKFGVQPAAYADQPWETVNYAACHDGEVLVAQVGAFTPQNALGWSSPIWLKVKVPASLTCTSYQAVKHLDPACGDDFLQVVN